MSPVLPIKPTTPVSPIASLLLQVESHLGLVSRAIADNQPDRLLAAADALQLAAVGLSKAVGPIRAGSVDNPVLKARIQKIVSTMASRREILIRQGVITGRALAALVPSSAQSPTYSSSYSPAATARGRNPYGGVARQSGEFKSLSA